MSYDCEFKTSIGWKSKFIIALIFALTFSASARAQGSSSVDAKSESLKCHSNNPEVLIKQSYEFSNRNSSDFPIEIPVQAYNFDGYAASFPVNSVRIADSSTIKKAPEGGAIVLRMIKPDNISPEDWQKSYLNGFAGQSSSEGKLLNIIRVQMSVREKSAQTLVVDASMPLNSELFKSSKWTLIPVICGGNLNKVLGYASVSVISVSVAISWIIAIVATLIFWAAISTASYQLNKSRLNNLWNAGGGIFKSFGKSSKLSEYLYKSLEAANPVFISQDSLGFGSLARFQILIFTTVVGFVLLFVFIHSGFISGISNTVLLLLGVTVAGSTFARATGDWIGINPATRRWLLTSGALEYQRDKPKWSDLFETQGEIDVAKVQALLFTVLICFGILASGYTGLSNFNLPEQTVYLACLSQGAYVFGKLLPADTRKQVEADVEAMRISASNLSANPGDSRLKLAYEESKRAAKRTLALTYTERFSPEKFDLATDDYKKFV